MTDEDELALDGVPTAFTVTVAKREPQELARHTFESLKGEKVIVRANGFVYRGTLVGADEGELYLRGEMRWVVLPLGVITGCVKDDAKDVPLGGPERFEPPHDPDAPEVAALDVRDEDE